MRAARYYGSDDVRIEDVSEPAAGDGEVKIEVAYAGICGTDIHEYVAGPINTPEEPHPVTGETVPITLGHELSGTVREVGAGVEGLAAGDRVAVNPTLPCMDCRYCHEGKHNVCRDLGFIGLSGNGGGLAEYVTVPARNAVPLPEGVSLVQGALAEPFTVCLHAADRSPLGAGDAVAVFGAGPVGLCMTQVARAAGAKRVFVSEPRAGRRERAETFGADVTIDPTALDPVEEIREQTGEGVDVAFEVAGVGPSHGQAIRSTVHDGHTTMLGIYEDTVEYDPNDVVLTERTVSGAHSFLGGPLANREFEATLALFERGELRTEGLVTSRLPLEETVAGFEALIAEDGDDVKVLLEP
jgi:(R,R)-butanediol dehydrogenase/meso-butanediol dehydrogenase/diacetyl reductase